MPESKMTEKPEAQRLTGLKKRQQIEIAGRTMFLWVAAASVALSFCVATGQYLFTKWQYNNKIISAKYKAADTLKKNVDSAKQLKEDVDALVANEPLNSVKTKETDSYAKSILDALPGTFDPAALATSLQQAILTRAGVTVESINVPPETDAAEATGPTPQEMKFSVVVSGPFDRIKTMLADMERTIRPMKVSSVNVNGTDSNLRATVEVITYYQPSKAVTIKKEAVK